MVGVGGGVNSREALAAAHEVEQRLPPGRRRRRVVRIVEERAGRAGEEDRVVLLQVLLVDVGGIVGDGRRPRAGLLAQLLDRAAGQRNRRMHEARGLAEHQHLARLLRLGRRRRRQRRHHRLDVLRLRRLILARAPAAARRYLRSRHRSGEPGGNLLLAERAGLGGIPLAKPALERRAHLVAGGRAVLVGVDGREEPCGCGPAATSAPARRRARRRLLRRSKPAAERRGKHGADKRRRQNLECI